MKTKAIIIIGLGYGDEGKGLITDYNCIHEKNPLVVRFSGGQQAGHSVYTKAKKHHVFSNFGSGTLRSVPTYWSKYCTFSPGFMLDEFAVLPSQPKLYVDRECPVTTHYDILFNRAIETFRGPERHGSCGLGFGATVNRHRDLEIKFTVRDLADKLVCRNKLIAIREYYKYKLESSTNYLFNQFDHFSEDEQFINDIDQLFLMQKMEILKFVDVTDILSPSLKWGSFIFEGSQGILLDPKFGQPPFVTKSSTTSENALRLIMSSLNSDAIDVEIQYVTRIYLTRHGAGPFPERDPSFSLTNTQWETNIKNVFQGEFKTTYLDIDFLNYAIRCDNTFSAGYSKKLFVTCIDQLSTYETFFTQSGKKVKNHYSILPSLIDCNFSTVKFSSSPFAEDIQ